MPTATSLPALARKAGQGRRKILHRTRFLSVGGISSASVLQLRQFTPEFQFQLTDLSALSDEEIRGHIWARVFQLILKHIFDERLGERLPAIIALAFDLAQRQTSLEMIAIILRYVAQAGVGVTIEAMRRAVMAVLPLEGGALMETVADQWVKQGFEQGIEQGIEQGRAEGRAESQRNTILLILERRFTLPAEERTMLGEQLVKIADLTALEALVDHALSAVLLADFKTRLRPYFDQPA